MNNKMESQNEIKFNDVYGYLFEGELRTKYWRLIYCDELVINYISSNVYQTSNLNRQIIHKPMIIF